MNSMDYDGDKCSCNAILTEEAIAEAKNMLSSKLSIVTPARKFQDTTKTKATQFALSAITRTNDEEMPEIDRATLTVHES